ncbi:hypothetical protein L336_0963 [Candidatus Saccharimonas aalborgensis]|uniref:Uncharacterized protein n=1 Tax=Candidatus Saccharimonas aalborgensis TaxID=1332188 RepID=R4PY19_9BACT|nr:hypothetical protein L336_0963 [Candidatus Saccharimonas aalborgensis]
MQCGVCLPLGGFLSVKPRADLPRDSGIESPERVVLERPPGDDAAIVRSAVDCVDTVEVLPIEERVSEPGRDLGPVDDLRRITEPVVKVVHEPSQGLNRADKEHGPADISNADNSPHGNKLTGVLNAQAGQLLLESATLELRGGHRGGRQCVHEVP